MISVDLHTHILPRNWPDFSERFGYGRKRFIYPEHGHEEGQACMRMMRGDSMFRRVWPNCYDPDVIVAECDENQIDVQVICTRASTLAGSYSSPHSVSTLSRKT